MLNIAVGEIETTRCLSTGERTTQITPLPRAIFDSAKQGSADAAKSCVRRNVIQSDFATIIYCGYPNYHTLLNGNQHRVGLVRYPDFKSFGRLVTKPQVQNGCIALMIRGAKVSYRLAHYLARGLCILVGCISYFHLA